MSPTANQLAMAEAVAFTDRVHLLPLKCLSAVQDMCGGAWDAGRVDLSPLVAALFDTVSSLESDDAGLPVDWARVEAESDGFLESDDAGLPEDVALDLLADCVEKGRDLVTWGPPAMADRLDPAAYLAALLRASTSKFLAARTLAYAEWCAQQNRAGQP